MNSSFHASASSSSSASVYPEDEEIMSGSYDMESSHYSSSDYIEESAPPAQIDDGSFDNEEPGVCSSFYGDDSAPQAIDDGSFDNEQESPKFKGFFDRGESSGREVEYIAFDMDPFTDEEDGEVLSEQCEMDDSYDRFSEMSYEDDVFDDAEILNSSFNFHRMTEHTAVDPDISIIEGDCEAFKGGVDEPDMLTYREWRARGIRERTRVVREREWAEFRLQEREREYREMEEREKEALKRAQKVVNRVIFWEDLQVEARVFREKQRKEKEEREKAAKKEVPLAGKVISWGALRVILTVRRMLKRLVRNRRR